MRARLRPLHRQHSYPPIPRFRQLSCYPYHHCLLRYQHGASAHRYRKRRRHGRCSPPAPRAIGASPLASEGGSFEVVVYPNPAQNTLFLANWQQIAAFKLYAISGVAVLGCSPVSGSQIGIAQLPAGLYIAEAQYKNGAIQRQKLLIHR
ncbi:T9SS C-terminal target domain-containing protein [Sphingobacteriales bacterium UPWRP_1]|nr:hypothetical protein BVG80_18450 [Sphingobacteriales bacterium TSM_CSM]PSJ73373.1 T9SS C-terminal target domain-containing protein [Sphingobacteriales bacterium UPWRP_1]